MTEASEHDDVRAALEAVLQQAKGDPAYLAALRDDPVGTLVAAGVPEGAAMHAAADELQLADVGGFRVYERGCPRYTYYCDGISCIVTMCADVPNTNVTMA